MVIIWSDFAASKLSEILDYYKELAGEKIAKKIKTNIFKTTRQLLEHPFSGQIEPTLQVLNEEHRYLINANFKIIYKLVKVGILITDVFDTRQEPVKMNNAKRKSDC